LTVYALRIGMLCGFLAGSERMTDKLSPENDALDVIDTP
jgi:hypothetical protein